MDVDSLTYMKDISTLGRHLKDVWAIQAIISLISVPRGSYKGRIDTSQH